MTHNRYTNTAQFYDLDPRGLKHDDIPFYLEHAEKAGIEILELACGTGRVTIPLAKNCFNVTALDISDYMLNIFRENLDKLPPQIQNKIGLIKGDMTNFELRKKFDMVFIPFRSFQLLTEEHGNANCLKMVHKHLKDDGLFIINCFKPYAKLDKSWETPETENWVVFDEKNEVTVKRTETRQSIDITKQLLSPIHTYYVTDREDQTEVFYDNLKMKYYYEGQLKTLLAENGFDVVEAYGYYDKTSIKDGSELIFVCRKK